MKPSGKIFIFILCIVISCGINILTIKDGHNWGGDFGQYLTHAQNIVEHKDYAHSFRLGKGVVSPPGFPCLLAIAIKFFGVNFKIFKLLNVFFWLGFVIALFPIMKRHLGENDALLGSILLLFSSDFFILKQSVITDVPFLFFLTASLYAVVKYCESIENRDPQAGTRTLILSILFMCCAFFIRWAGAILFISVILYFTFIKRNGRMVLTAILALTASALIQKALGMDPEDHLKEIVAIFSYWLIMILGQTSYIIKTAIVFFFPFKTKCSMLIFSILRYVIIIIHPLIYVSIIFVFINKFRKKSLAFIECFFVIYLLGIILWWMKGGTRYIYPIIGPIIIFFIAGCKNIEERFFSKTKRFRFVLSNMARGILVFIILHNVASITSHFDFNDDMIYQSDAREMVEWIKTNTQKDDRIVFGKPRVLGFLTNRYTASYFYMRETGKICQQILQTGMDYIVKMDFSPELSLPTLNHPDLPLKALASDRALVPTGYPYTFPIAQFKASEIEKCPFSTRLVWGRDKSYKIFKIERESRP